MSHKDPEAKKQYQREYEATKRNRPPGWGASFYQKHKDRFRTEGRTRYAENKELFAAQKREYRAMHPEKVREQGKRSDIKHVAARRVARHDYQTRLRERNTLRVNTLKSAPCADCKKTFPPCCMDYDHRDPETKKFTISRGLAKSWSMILREIAKCDLVCACCHRIRTWTRGQGRDSAKGVSPRLLPSPTDPGFSPEHAPRSAQQQMLLGFGTITSQSDAIIITDDLVSVEDLLRSGAICRA